jgi:hypothetical protein
MTYPLIEFCESHGIELDRKTYIAINYPDGPPDPWTPEDEAMLPEEFRE